MDECKEGRVGNEFAQHFEDFFTTAHTGEPVVHKSDFPWRCHRGGKYTKIIAANSYMIGGTESITAEVASDFIRLYIDAGSTNEARVPIDLLKNS